MKRTLYRCLAVLLLLAMACSLCGCQELDEMRESHAILQEDGSILWDEKIFLPLPEENIPAYLDYDYMQYIYVTEPEVPVLLSTVMVEDILILSAGGNYLNSINDDALYCEKSYYEKRNFG